MALRNDQDGLLGELIAQQLPPLVAHYARQGGTIRLGRAVREAIQAQGWTLDNGGKARVDAEWLASVLKAVDDGQTEVGHNPALTTTAWAKLAQTVESKNRGQG